MSTIFADNFKNTSGGDPVNINEVKTDKITGKTTAGSIPVQGEGSATTNLQQGLIKAWGNFDGSGTVGINDSFNMDALTDNGTGNYTMNITNDFANAHGCMSGYAIMDGLCYGDNSNVSSAGSFRMRVVVGHSNSGMDPDEFHTQMAGDLA
tara:strand:+ start:550 stop:1002 length:453 start_codon:yes stop_codon:yes gene_type:complete